MTPRPWRRGPNGPATVGSREYNRQRLKRLRAANPEWVAMDKARQKEWRDQNPELRKHRMLKHKFGIGLEEYRRMLEAQHGICGICGGTSEGKSLAVDHCHTTGKIRGLLCDNCNRALGQFKESPEVLKRALKYLEQHENG